VPGGAAEILVERVEGVRLELAVYAAQLLLNPVDGVEEETAIHFQLAAAEFPVGAEQEVEAEQLVFLIVEITFADQAEIGDIFLVFSSPNLTPDLASEERETHMGHVPFALDTILEPRIADTKYGSQDAVAGGIRTCPVAAPQSMSMA
jgi:hypothetical protein